MAKADYFARVVVDGNTELRIGRVAVESMSTRLRAMLECMSGGRVGEAVRCIVPKRPWVDGSGKVGEREAILASRAWVSGRKGARTYHAEFPGAFHFIFSERHGTVSIQLPAAELWAIGYEALASWVIRVLHTELFWGLESRREQVDPGDALRTASRGGWFVSRLELCTDLRRYGRDMDAEHLGFKARPTYWGVDAEQETFETMGLGGPASAVRLRVYDKIAECMAGEDTRWKYAERWREGGWEEGMPVTRVEMVLKDGALVIEAREGVGESEIDMTDPAAVACADLRGKCWTYHAEKKRRIEPYTATRRERCRTHSDWVRVVEAGAGLDDFRPLDYRQRRRAQASALDTMADRDTAAALNAGLRFAARELGIASTHVHASALGALQFRVTGELVEDDERTAQATRLAAQLGLEAMLSRVTPRKLREKADYLATYFELKKAEFGDEMRDRAARFIPPGSHVEAWRERETHEKKDPLATGPSCAWVEAC